jgi:hypothetical protein
MYCCSVCSSVQCVAVHACRTVWCAVLKHYSGALHHVACTMYRMQCLHCSNRILCIAEVHRNNTSSQSKLASMQQHYCRLHTRNGRCDDVLLLRCSAYTLAYFKLSVQNVLLTVCCHVQMSLLRDTFAIVAPPSLNFNDPSYKVRLQNHSLDYSYKKLLGTCKLHVYMLVWPLALAPHTF